MIQEDIENRTVNLAISTGKLTWRTLVTALEKLKEMNAQYQAEQERKKLEPKHGKQSVKELIRQNQGVSNLAIDSTGIRGFERVARKYGVDFAIRKDRSHSPPRYLVFFKARDVDAITSAFEEYTAKRMRRQKPSVRAELFKEVDIPDLIKKPHGREKVQER